MKLRFEIPVGIVILIAMGILGYYTIIMSDEFLEKKDTYEMTVLFPNTEGLKVNNQVKVNGVLSGTVTDITLAGHQVMVKLEMFNRFPLYENYTIDIRIESALGGKGISIYPGSPADAAGKVYNEVTDFHNLEGGVDDPLYAITKIIEENRDNVRASILNIKQITDKINNGQGTLGKLITEDSIHSDAGKLVKDLREAIEDSREQAPVTSFIRAALLAF